MSRATKAKKPGKLKIVVNKTKMQRFLRHNVPKQRSTGRDLHKCPRCYSNWGYIGKYGLNICRRCFRELAPKLGFKKNR